MISTTFFPFTPQIESVAAFVKENAPEIPIIAGGIQIWKSYRTRALLESGTLTEDIRDSVIRDHYLLDFSRPSLVDFLVVSDQGEHTLSQLLHGMRRGDVSHRMDNIAYFAEGRWHLNPVRAEADDFLLEPMDWSQLPTEFTREEIPRSCRDGLPISV